MSEDDKADFVPLKDRRSDSSVLGVSEVEFLDRLVERGEGLMMEGLIFSQAAQLLATGHARITKRYELNGAVLYLFKPTEKGRALAAARKKMKGVRGARKRKASKQ